MVGPMGSVVWHKAQTAVTLRSAADVYCLQTLQQLADAMSLIILPDATHTCMAVQSQCKVAHQELAVNRYLTFQHMRTRRISNQSPPHVCGTCA